MPKPSYTEQLRQLKQKLKSRYLETWERERIEQHIFHIQEQLKQHKRSK